MKRFPNITVDSIRHTVGLKITSLVCIILVALFASVASADAENDSLILALKSRIKDSASADSVRADQNVRCNSSLKDDKACKTDPQKSELSRTEVILLSMPFLAIGFMIILAVVFTKVGKAMQPTSDM